VKRQIININEELCNGCGLCVSACHEGAIVIEGGKARLWREDYCDGLGNCLPVCPTGALSFEQREAAAYDAEAVEQQTVRVDCELGGCSGAKICAIERIGGASRVGELRQWPVQIKLAPVRASYFAGAELLIAADCAAYACGNFHSAFMRGRVTLIGCPKLDGVDYSEKLAAIIGENDISKLLVVRMEVPCCYGLEKAAKDAVRLSGRAISCSASVLSTEGEILP
jgi:ferredoxin